MPPFTDRLIKHLPPKASPYRIFEAASDPGFCIQVTPAGTRTFQQQYTAAGARRYLRIGIYPDMPLSLARAKAREARAVIENGIDPQAEREKRAAQSSLSRGTVAQLADHYIGRLKGRTIIDVRQIMDKNVLPFIGERPAKEIEPDDIRDLLYRIIKRGAEVHANRVRSYLHAMFKVGVHHDNDPRAKGARVLFGIKHNPVTDVPKDGSVESACNRVLSWDEIRHYWNADEIPLPHRLALRLILITGGGRPGEITGAPRDEFDLGAKLWTLPATRAKNRREHLTPLTDLAIDTIEQIRAIYTSSAWLFPARHNPKASRPWARSVLPHAVQDYCATCNVTSWVPKDLRRTWKTRAGELGISKFTRDRVQNHVIGDVSEKHYDRYDYLPEKRAALEAWATHLQAMISGANVIAIRS